ncbi:hypothetical protein ACLMJK_008524 [Lecanora helva]
MSPIPDSLQTNYSILRDCLATAIITASAPTPDIKTKRRRSKTNYGRKKTITSDSVANNPPEKEQEEPHNDAEDLAEFIDYLTAEIFTSLPAPLQSLSYASLKSSPDLAAQYATPLPPSTLTSLLSHIPPTVTDTLTTYTLLPPTTFLTPLLTTYTTTTTTPPPSLSSLPSFPYKNPSHVQTPRPTSCEICLRPSTHVPLTYHHLIPRSTHAKCLKRGWHQEWELDAVAWLCRACHGFVHRVAGNEELAREFWSVERLVGREDVGRWRRWRGRG